MTLLTRQQQAIAAIILSDVPVPMSELSKRLYADRTEDGGPENAHITIRTQLCYMRRALAPHGIKILCLRSGWAEGGYMIDPDHADAMRSLLAAVSASALRMARAKRYVSETASA